MSFATPAVFRRRRGAAPLFVPVFALVLLTLLGAHAVNLAIVYFFPPPPPEFFRVSEVAAALRAPDHPVAVQNGLSLTSAFAADLAPPQHQRPTRVGGILRGELADQLARPLADVRLYFLDSGRSPVRRSVRSYQRQLSPAASDQRSDNFVVAPFVAAVRTADGRWSVLRREETAPFTSWTQRVILWFAASAVALAPLAWLFSRRFAAPFAEFADAAGRLGRDPGAPPLERIRGPAEVQTAAAAFNDMQGRLNRYVHDRTAMVGAIAHDLRTPLTRLRFRVESAPAPLAGKMTADIEQMEQMIADTMAFVRDATHQGERRRLELSSLVQTVADEMADTGLDVSSDGRAPVVVYGDALALRRLISNLLDNAVKFGACAPGARLRRGGRGRAGGGRRRPRRARAGARARVRALPPRRTQPQPRHRRGGAGPGRGAHHRPRPRRRGGAGEPAGGRPARPGAPAAAPAARVRPVGTLGAALAAWLAVAGVAGRAGGPCAGARRRRAAPAARAARAPGPAQRVRESLPASRSGGRRRVPTPPPTGSGALTRTATAASPARSSWRTRTASSTGWTRTATA